MELAFDSLQASFYHDYPLTTLANPNLQDHHQLTAVGVLQHSSKRHVPLRHSLLTANNNPDFGSLDFRRLWLDPNSYFQVTQLAE